MKLLPLILKSLMHIINFLGYLSSFDSYTNIPSIFIPSLSKFIDINTFNGNIFATQYNFESNGKKHIIEHFVKQNPGKKQPKKK